MNCIIRAKLTAVEYAMIFFISIRDLFRLTTQIPNIFIIVNITGMDHNDAKYKPATTIVDECSNEDTGVGPSIAIGSQ